MADAALGELLDDLAAVGAIFDVDGGDGDGADAIN